MRRTEFFNLQKKSTRRYPALILAGWLHKTLTLEKHCLSFCLSWFISSLTKHPSHWTVLTMHHALPFRLDEGLHLHFRAREVQAQKTMGYSRYKKPKYKENATNPDILTFNPELLSNSLLLKMKTDSTLSTTPSVALGINLIFFFLCTLRMVPLQKPIMYYIIKVWTTLIASS